MSKKSSSYARLEQPINWSRAILCGVIGAAILMAWVDIFAMMGLTPFTFEIYVGSVVQGSTEYLPRAWIWGFLGNLIIGGVFGLFYAYLFEFIYFRSGARIGTALGFVHTVVVAVAVLPFFEIVHDQMGIPLYPHGLGFLGANLGAVTPLVILFGHLLFGASVGLFYGPVREDRVRTHNFEPGEVGYPGDPDVITPAEDPRGATPANPYHAPGSAFPRISRRSKRQQSRSA